MTKTDEEMLEELRAAEISVQLPIEPKTYRKIIIKLDPSSKVLFQDYVRIIKRG